MLRTTTTTRDMPSGMPPGLPRGALIVHRPWTHLKWLVSHGMWTSWLEVLSLLLMALCGASKTLVHIRDGMVVSLRAGGRVCFDNPGHNAKLTPGFFESCLFYAIREGAADPRAVANAFVHTTDRRVKHGEYTWIVSTLASVEAIDVGEAQRHRSSLLKHLSSLYLLWCPAAAH
jgi:hypothetical protein